MQTEEYTTGTQENAHKVLQVGSSIDVAICRDAATAVLIARLLNEHADIPMPEDFEHHRDLIDPRFEDPKPHNPDGLESPGEGYRFLDEDEIILRKSVHSEIEIRVKTLWDNTGWIGNCPSLTYRTKLSREELAKLV